MDNQNARAHKKNIIVMYVYDKSNQIKRKVRELAGLVIVLLRINPEITTINRFKTPPFTLPEGQTTKYEKLFRMLVHVSTIINIQHRIKDQHGRYMSQREDYINALELMKDLVLYFDVREGAYEHEILAQMQVIQDKYNKITSKALQEQLCYSSSSTKRIITVCLDRGWIIRTGGNKKEGYTYVLTKR